jgi:hypothetical protein
MKYLLTTLTLVFFVFPEMSQAQGLISADLCDGTTCSACHLVELGNNLIKWLIGLVMMLFAVLAVWAGFGLVTSGGNPSALQDAKSRFTNAFIGLLIVLSAWMVVDTLMRGLVGNGGNFTGAGPWSQIQCFSQSVASTVPGTISIEEFWPGDPNSVNSGATVVATQKCAETPGGFTDCAAAVAACAAGTTAFTDTTDVTNHYVNCVQGGAAAPFSGTPASGCDAGTCAALTIPCKSGANCSISLDMVSRLAGMHTTAGVGGARVTEGFPPTRTHKSQCHYNGTCIDYSKAGGMTSAEVLAVYQAATANGLRPVYEVGSESRRQALISGGVPAASVKNYGSWISGEHFSIYGY